MKTLKSTLKTNNQSLNDFIRSLQATIQFLGILLTNQQQDED